jgi:malonyl CoA-acyl carrier protein transacylase
MRCRSTALISALANGSAASRCAALGPSGQGRNANQAAQIRCFSASSSASILITPPATTPPRPTVAATSATNLGSASNATRPTSTKSQSPDDPIEEKEEDESSWAFGGGGAGPRSRPAAGGQKSTTYDSQDVVDDGTSDAAMNTPSAPFVVKGNAGKGAVPHYGRRRADIRYNAEEYRAVKRDEAIAGSYRHDYAPTSRTKRPLPHHTYFSNPSSSFNDDAAATAAGVGPVGVGGPRSGLGMGAGMHETGQVKGKKSIARKKTALILPGQGSQYVAMSLDIYRKYRSARETWSIAEESLLLRGDSRRSKYPAKEEKATSEEQRLLFEKELAKSEKWDSVKEMTNAGSAVARGRRGWLRDLVFSGDQLNLTRAENAQISILVSSLSILSVLRQEFPIDLISNHIDYVAGHGSGVYAALCASGALDIRDGVRVLRHRGLTTSHYVWENKTLFPEGCTRPESIYETWAFANAGSGKGAELLSTATGIDQGGVPPTSTASDAAVVEEEIKSSPKRGWKRSQMSGCMIRPGKLEQTLKAIEKLASDIKMGKKAGVATDEVVEVANINSSLQIVLSGTRVGVSLASDMLRDHNLGARAVNLPVSGPYHSSILNDAAEFLKPTIEYLPLQTHESSPQGQGYAGPLQLISSMKGASSLDSVEAIRADLSGALVKPVMWLETIEKLLENGVQRFICLGPGRACAHLLSKELAYRDRQNISQGKEAGQYEVWSVTSVEDVEQIGDMLTQLSLDEGAVEKQGPSDAVAAL